MAAPSQAMAAAATNAADSGDGGQCDPGNSYSSQDLGIRVSAIFVILVGGFLGAVFPVIARRSKNKALMPPIVFFIAKYFGSGVIVATAFIHLLAPAADALTDPCLTGPITDYDWAEGIALMTIFVLFFVELLIMRSGAFEGHSHAVQNEFDDDDVDSNKGDVNALAGPSYRSPSVVQTPARGEDHLGHSHDHTEVVESGSQTGKHESDVFAATSGQVQHGSYDDYAAQMTAIFILEFGIIFHSIFIGLTLAVTASDQFSVLYVVLVFHQTFEGLGLGTRLAMTPWPKTPRGRWTPYVMALGFGLATPVATAIGLGVRETFAPTSQTALIVNGVFDSISAGILLYTGLVELMAHEFMFSNTMRKAKVSVLFSAFGVMSLGAGLMALLGKWA